MLRIALFIYFFQNNIDFSIFFTIITFILNKKIIPDMLFVELMIGSNFKAVYTILNTNPDCLGTKPRIPALRFFLAKHQSVLIGIVLAWDKDWIVTVVYFILLLLGKSQCIFR